MPELEFDKPEGCIAEGHYFLEINRKGTYAKVAEVEFHIVCAEQLGPFQEDVPFTAETPDQLDDGIEIAKRQVAAESARLLVPYCLSCPNNPSYQEARVD